MSDIIPKGFSEYRDMADEISRLTAELAGAKREIERLNIKCRLLTDHDCPNQPLIDDIDRWGREVGVETDKLQAERDTALLALAARDVIIGVTRDALLEAHALNINWSSDAEPETLAYYSEYKKVIAQGKKALSLSPNEVAEAVEGMREALKGISAYKAFNGDTWPATTAFTALALYDKSIKGIK